jgi:hypothetical protein
MRSGLNLKQVSRGRSHHFFSILKGFAMDELSVPQPPADPAGQASRRSGGKKRGTEGPRQGRPPIASVDDCLAILSRLGGLVTLGMLSPAKANTLRGVYTTILQHHERQQSGPSRTIGNDQELAKLLRKHPDLSSLLEPLLTDEQIAVLMGGGKDAGDGDEAA